MGVPTSRAAHRRRAARAPSASACAALLAASARATARSPQTTTPNRPPRLAGDDFECTSSPAVEQTVRALARDLQRGAYGRTGWQPDVTYEDGFRSCKGSDKVGGRPLWVKEVLRDAKVVRGAAGGAFAWRDEGGGQERGGAAGGWAAEEGGRPPAWGGSRKAAADSHHANKPDQLK